MSAILDVGADGMLCAKLSRRKMGNVEPALEVIAGTGKFAELPARGVLSDALPFTPLVRRAFEQGQSCFEHPYDALHFSGRSLYHYVILFTPPWPLEDYQKDLLGIFCDRMASAFDNLYLYQQLKASNEATVMALADLAEYRDESTGTHLARVRRLTEALVERLYAQGRFRDEITETFRTLIGTASILHDVGKVSTPDHILLKPGRHTEEERIIMQEHARNGEAILERAAALINGESYLSVGAQIAGGHHERFDGQGYPRKLKGTEIPLASRVVAVVDVFDALVHRRMYKEPWPVDKALASMREGSGTQFDPEVLEAFFSVVGDDPEAWVDRSEL